MASRDIKVGVFVLLSLLVLGVLIFMIGSESQMFEKHTEVKSAFRDVQGLSRGSPVRMGGVDIGRVTSVDYGPDPKDHTIFVQMSVVSTEARRIRKDSVATVEGKGLLGDKMIVITPGSLNQAPLAEGELIPSEESRDLTEIVTDLKGAAAGAERVIANLEKTTDAFAEETFTSDVKSTVHHLTEILRSMDEGDGYVGQLLHDPKEAENLSQTIARFRSAAAQLEGLMADSRQVVKRVQTGPGFVHEVVYGESGSEALSQVGGAAEEMALALKGIRQGDSFAHSMLYQKESAQMVENLNRASEDLSKITADLREGKGTFGAFLTDPSVYEDVKVLLGNVGRNRSLRALVRYSVMQDEKTGRVRDPGPSESKPTASASATASTEASSAPPK
jgi:phospholipid/cholesterol/gamma-HCH transport system substrate-binding protein